MKKMLFFGFIFILIVACKKSKQEKPVINKIAIEWVSKPDQAVVGDAIEFSFKSNKANAFRLKLTNGFSATLTNGITNNTTTKFLIPSHISKRAGLINYYVLHEKNVISKGVITVHPDKELNILESYFGPQHIVASTDDFSSLVTIPTDIYDNPNKITFSTNISYKNTEEILTNKLTEIIHYRNYFSKTKKGKIFVKSKSNSVYSKKFEARILASSPIDFKIDYDRNNSLADGKELTTLMTSVIKDKYDNTIENGTLVSFILKGNNKTLKVYGKTINGIAKTQILHPKTAQSFIITAYVNGFANSNDINISYK